MAEAQARLEHNKQYIAFLQHQIDLKESKAVRQKAQDNAVSQMLCTGAAVAQENMTFQGSDQQPLACPLRQCCGDCVCFTSLVKRPALTCVTEQIDKQSGLLTGQKRAQMQCLSTSQALQYEPHANSSSIKRSHGCTTSV